jgi:hypothetical protein
VASHLFLGTVETGLLEFLPEKEQKKGLQGFTLATLYFKFTSKA